jgi:hypothetical protein
VPDGLPGRNIGRFHPSDLLRGRAESSKGIRFADFKFVQSTYDGIPDVILKDDNHQRKVIGELKVPWISRHNIEGKLDRECSLRKILAQPIMYMQHLGCRVYMDF